MEEESTGDVIQIVRPAAVQKDRLACTAAPDIGPDQNHMNKKADTPNCEWGGGLRECICTEQSRWYKIEKTLYRSAKNGYNIKYNRKEER